MRWREGSVDFNRGGRGVEIKSKIKPVKFRKLLNRHCVLAGLLTVAACFTPEVSADLLTNTWFKLTFEARGHTLGTNNATVKRLNITRTLYVNISTNTPAGVSNSYRLHLWTRTDAGWSNTFTPPIGVVAEGLKESFFSELFLPIVGTSNSMLYTYHTAFINVRTNTSGRLRTATYTGGGHIYDGDISGKRFFGTFSLMGSRTSPSRLPFTP
jgi:hypothetical protein